MNNMQEALQNPPVALPQKETTGFSKWSGRSTESESVTGLGQNSKCITKKYSYNTRIQTGIHVNVQPFGQSYACIHRSLLPTLLLAGGLYNLSTLMEWRQKKKKSGKWSTAIV